MQKENNKLLEAEARELANVLNETLFSVVYKASNVKQATELLLSTGLINQKAVRNMAVINDCIVEKWWQEPGINNSGSDDDPYIETTPENTINYLSESK